MADLSMAVELRFDDSTLNSHKYYRAVLAGNLIAISYGRQYSAGNLATHTLESEDKANAKFWSLLREKAGKGYRVVDAIVYADDRGIANQIREATNTGRQRIARNLVAEWQVTVDMRRRDGLTANQPQPDWRSVTRSPRTAADGKSVIGALRDPNCPEDILLDCAMAADTERFLWPMALSHPNCPDEARVARALVAMALA